MCATYVGGVEIKSHPPLPLYSCPPHDASMYQIAHCRSESHSLRTKREQRMRYARRCNDQDPDTV